MESRYNFYNHGHNYFYKFIKNNPEFDTEEFFKYVVGKNRGDRDSGEVESIAKHEILRLAYEFAERRYRFPNVYGEHNEGFEHVDKPWYCNRMKFSDEKPEYYNTNPIDNKLDDNICETTEHIIPKPKGPPLIDLIEGKVYIKPKTPSNRVIKNCEKLKGRKPTYSCDCPSCETSKKNN